MDEYGQPISVQVDGRKGRGHRRRRPHCTGVPAGGHWEALRAMGLMEGEKGRGDGYRAAWVPKVTAGINFLLLINRKSVN